MDLFARYAPLARSIARMFWRISRRRWLDLADYEQEAAVALLAAIAQFDEGYGVSREFYYRRVVQWRMRDLLKIRAQNWAGLGWARDDEPEHEDLGADDPLERAAVSEVLDEIVHLPSRVATVMRYRLGGFSLSEVGKKLGVSKRMILKLEAIGVVVLRNRLRGSMRR